MYFTNTNQITHGDDTQSSQPSPTLDSIWSFQMNDAMRLLRSGQHLVVSHSSTDEESKFLKEICKNFNNHLCSNYHAIYMNMDSVRVGEDFIDLLATSLMFGTSNCIEQMSTDYTEFMAKFNIVLARDIYWNEEGKLGIHVPRGYSLLSAAKQLIYLANEILKGRGLGLILILDNVDNVEGFSIGKTVFPWLATEVMGKKNISVAFATRSQTLKDKIRRSFDCEQSILMELPESSLETEENINLSLGREDRHNNWEGSIDNSLAVLKLIIEHKTKGRKQTSVKPSARKNGDEEAKEEGSEESNDLTVVKRKPGRKPGQKKRNEEAPDDKSGLSLTKSKPGRKPRTKNQTEEDGKEESHDLPDIKRKQGPRGVSARKRGGDIDEASEHYGLDSDSQSQTQSQPESPVKRKPGRPKGSKTKKRSEDQSNGAEAESLFV